MVSHWSNITFLKALLFLIIGLWFQYLERLKLDLPGDELPSASDCNKKPKKRWSRKQKRTFRHLNNGIVVTKKLGYEDLKFVTLTTSDICVLQRHYGRHSLSRDAVRLRQRIERLTPWKLYKYGYLTRKQLPHFYGRESYNKMFGKIDYLQVFTNEGNGVIHILGRFPYLPYNYLSSEWFDIHLSYNVNITKIKLDFEAKNTASYIVSQYIANQGTSYVRSSMSKYWIFPGHNRIWKECLHRSKDFTRQYKTEWGFFTAPIQIDIAIKVWNSYLNHFILSEPIKHIQRDLEGLTASLIDLLPGAPSMETFTFGGSYEN